MARTLYDLLEVPRGVAPTEIKRSFRRLAKRYHPDVNRGRGAAERFLEIQAAYQVLANPLLRREYDEKLEPRTEFRWEPPVAYDGPSHKVKMPRGYVGVAGPFPSAGGRAELRRQRATERRRRFAGRVWIAYVAVVLSMVTAMFAFAGYLAATGLGFQAAITASGGGMMLGLLFIAWIARGITAPDL